MVFIYRYSTFEYIAMPPGLTNVLTTFQYLMNSVFADFINNFLTVHLDNLLVYSASKLEPLVYLYGL